jgi:hypothetical protein
MRVMLQHNPFYFSTVFFVSNTKMCKLFTFFEVGAFTMYIKHVKVEDNGIVVPAQSASVFVI